MEDYILPWLIPSNLLLLASAARLVDKDASERPSVET